MGGGGNTTITNTAERINGIQIQSSAYGRCIPIIYGTQRLASNLFWYDDFVATPHTTTTTSGGKGGGGSVTQSNTTYTYSASLMFALCEGEITGTGMVWVDKATSTIDALNLALFKGSYTQTTWGFLDSNHSDKALSYRGTAYLASPNFDLGDNASLPNMTFEVKGMKLYNTTDANPKDIIYDFMTNDKYGIGFPSSKIGDLTVFNTYCLANNILLSPMFDEQKGGNEHIEDFLKATNSSFVWSEGKLKIIPYGDAEAVANGFRFVPNLTPIYDLTDKDFLNIDEPIRVTRSANADAFNHIKIEFLNRANQYNAEIAEAKDLANIDLFGLRPSDTIQMHSICDASIAKSVAQLILQRTLYVRNTYEFKLSWKYCLLEPMDLVTLTDPILGFDKLVVRITEISEDDESVLSFTAEEFSFGVASATLYPSQSPEGTAINYNVPVGNINQPVIFEPPLLLSNAYEIWIGLSGDSNWGGAELWVSYDSETYTYLTKVTQPSRMGYTTQYWNGGTVEIDLAESRGSLISTSEALAMIENEIVKYSIAELIGEYKYRLTIIERGLYGTTEEGHQIGSRFTRLDSALNKQPYTTDMIGRTIYYKALSYNVYGVAKQSLAEVEPFAYTVKGLADASPLPNVQNITSYYLNNQQVIVWDTVVDKFRSPIDYEIRRGIKWGKALILGRTNTTTFNAYSSGTYLVKAHYTTPQGIDAYSEDSAVVVIEGTAFVRNVVASFDERALGWQGDLVDGATIEDDAITLSYGTTVVPFGAYESKNIVILSEPTLCGVSLDYSVGAENIHNFIDNIPDFDMVSDFDGDYSGYYDIKAKIALSQDGTTWGDWADYHQGDYVAKAFKFRIELNSKNENVRPILADFSFTVDMPDRFEKGTSITVSTNGLSVLFAKPFQIKPNTQITIVSAVEGDFIQLTNESKDGFSVVIKNNNVGVSRVINWLSQGY